MTSDIPRLKGFRFPREIIAYAVWAYHRFALSTADVEDLLSERGVIVSRETVRSWVNRFGRHSADCIKRDRPVATDKWHLYEVVVPIGGVKYWLWRTIDATGDVLDILVQPRRNAKAARRFLKRLVTRFGTPRVVVKDKLRMLYQTDPRSRAGTGSPGAQGSQQPHGGTAPTDPQTRKTPWAGSSPKGRPRDFSLPMTKSTLLPTPPLPPDYKIISPHQIRCFRPLASLCTRNGFIRHRKHPSLKSPETTWQCRRDHLENTPLGS